MMRGHDIPGTPLRFAHVTRSMERVRVNMSASAACSPQSATFMRVEHYRSERPAVVVLNWNNAERTIATARALANWQHVQPKIIVVDNASSAADRSALASLADVAQILFQPTNLGYAGGNNVGIRTALELGHEFILLLNNDATLAEDAALGMMRAMAEHPQLGLVGPVIVEMTPRGKLLTAGGRNIALFPNTRRTLPIRGTASALLPVSYVPGTVALIRAAVFRQAGCLDERFFFSGEMADLCRRARAKGFECAVLTTSQAFHRKQTASSNIAALHAYYTLRNRFLYVRNSGRAVGALRVYWAAIGLAMLGVATGRRNHTLRKAIQLALRDGWQESWGNRNDVFLTQGQCDHS